MTDPKKPVAKKAGKKTASKKAPAKGPKLVQDKDPQPPKHAPGKAITKPTAAKEIDTTKLTTGEAQKRVATIYKLEKTIQAKRKLHDLAKVGAKSAKAALTTAEDALAQEIDEQRFGPGPLFPN